MALKYYENTEAQKDGYYGAVLMLVWTSKKGERVLGYVHKVRPEFLRSNGFKVTYPYICFTSTPRLKPLLPIYDKGRMVGNKFEDCKRKLYNWCQEQIEEKQNVVNIRKKR